jgi:hypothetical protein
MAFEGASKWDNVPMNNYILINKALSTGCEGADSEICELLILLFKSGDGTFPLFTEQA